MDVLPCPACNSGDKTGDANCTVCGGNFFVFGEQYDAWIAEQFSALETAQYEAQEEQAMTLNMGECSVCHRHEDLHYEEPICQGCAYERDMERTGKAYATLQATQGDTEAVTKVLVEASMEADRTHAPASDFGMDDMFDLWLGQGAGLIMEQRADRQQYNLESGHTASGMNIHDLRETTADVLASLPQDDRCGDPDDFCRNCNQPNELNEHGWCQGCSAGMHLVVQRPSDAPHYYTGEDDVPCVGCGDFTMLNEENYCIYCWGQEEMEAADERYNPRVIVDGQVILDALPAHPAEAATCMDFDSEYDRLFCACGNPYGEGRRCRYCD